MYEQLKDLILRTGLTADQLVYLISMYKNDRLVFQYPKPFFRVDIKELIDLGYVVGDSTNIANNVLTPLVSELLFIDEDEAAKEIWDLYPNYFDKYQTKSMDKELFTLIYQSKTENNRFKHERIKELLGIAISNGWINRKIENWIRSDQWEEWEQQLEELKPRKESEEFR